MDTDTATPKRNPWRPLKGAGRRSERLSGRVEPWVLDYLDSQPGSRMDTVTALVRAAWERDR